MSGKIAYLFNRRTIAVLVVSIVLLLVIGWVIYRDSQKPVAERISGYTWCLIPYSPFLEWEFNGDGTFVRKIKVPDGYGITATFERGKWSIDEGQDRLWIQITNKETQEEELFPITITANLGSYFLRLKGDFQPLPYKTVYLYRCAKQ